MNDDELDTLAAAPDPTGQEAPPREAGWSASLLRLVAMRGVPGLPAQAGLRVLAPLALLCIALWIGLDWLRAGDGARFYPYYGVPAMACHALALVALGAILSQASTPRPGLARVLAVLLAATPLAILATVAIDDYAPPAGQLVAQLVLAGWLLVFTARALRELCGRAQPGAVLLALLAGLAFAWAGRALYLDPGVWIEQEDEEQVAEDDWREAERILFSQSQRIDEAVAALAPPDPDNPSVYFLGFAGVGEQRVFAEEIGLAARVVVERYGARDRVLKLVNDRRDLEALPLASPSALRYTLHALGKRMRPQDILFLALSSHGGEGLISVSNGVMMLQDLDAAELASALAESGIGWRVIVISACHAGSFIDALKDPRTIVLTAAAADRTSFGCSDERELTYFGEAFYRDALPLAGSLRDAFEQTRSAIGEREKQEQIEASDPQAWFGTELEARLEPLERAATRADGIN